MGWNNQVLNYFVLRHLITIVDLHLAHGFNKVVRLPGIVFQFKTNIKYALIKISRQITDEQRFMLGIWLFKLFGETLLGQMRDFVVQ